MMTTDIVDNETSNALRKIELDLVPSDATT